MKSKYFYIVLFAVQLLISVVANAQLLQTARPEEVGISSAKAAGQTVLSEVFAAPAVGDNGHSLQVNGMKLWTPVVDKWLEQKRF